MFLLCGGTKKSSEPELFPAIGRPWEVPRPTRRSADACSTPTGMTPSSARCVLATALTSCGRVDFPTVTEICDRAQDDNRQMLGVVKLLTLALQGGDRARQLKALTVAHELLYDARAREVLFTEPGLIEALEGILNKEQVSIVMDGPFQRPAEEAVQLLAFEILRRLYSEFDIIAPRPNPRDRVQCISYLRSNVQDGAFWPWCSFKSPS